MKNPSNKENQKIKNREPGRVKTVIWNTVKCQKVLSAGILIAVIGAVVVALLPLWTENHTFAQKQSDGEIHKSHYREY